MPEIIERKKGRCIYVCVVVRAHRPVSTDALSCKVERCGEDLRCSCREPLPGSENLCLSGLGDFRRFSGIGMSGSAAVLARRKRGLGKIRMGSLLSERWIRRG